MPDERITYFRRRDYVKITVFGFALTALWQSLHAIILPPRLLDFIPETQKNTYLGLMTLVGLFLAMLAQPLAGAISDRSGFRFGRRRPYILIGGIIAVLVIPGIGLAGSFAVLFTVYCLLQISTNTAQGPFQAFIPDFVPAGNRGIASGVKALLEIAGGAILVYITSLLINEYSNGKGIEWLWLALGILAAILLGAVLATVLMVKERPVTGISRRTPLLSGLLQTAREVMGNRSLVWFLVSRMLVFMAFATIQQFAFYFLSDVLGVSDPAEATARFLIFSVSGMLIVVWPAGWLSDRIGRKPVTIASGLLGALGIAVIALSQEYGTVLWAAAIIGIAMGIFNSGNWALATDLVAKGEEARYLGIANMATAGGAALARAIGPAIDFFNGQSAGLGYNFMLMVCLAYFIVGAALVLKVKRQ